MHYKYQTMLKYFSTIISNRSNIELWCEVDISSFAYFDYYAESNQQVLMATNTNASPLLHFCGAISFLVSF